MNAKNHFSFERFFFLVALFLFLKASVVAREVTAADYCDFLNRVGSSDIISTQGGIQDTINPDFLYNAKMGSDPRAGSITRVHTPGGWQYEVIARRENIPVTYVNQESEEAYCRWLEVRQSQLTTSWLSSNEEDFNVIVDADSSLMMAVPKIASTFSQLSGFNQVALVACMFFGGNLMMSLGGGSSSDASTDHSSIENQSEDEKDEVISGEADSVWYDAEEPTEADARDLDKVLSPNLSTDLNKARNQIASELKDFLKGIPKRQRELQQYQREIDELHQKIITAYQRSLVVLTFGDQTSLDRLALNYYITAHPYRQALDFLKEKCEITSGFRKESTDGVFTALEGEWNRFMSCNSTMLPLRDIHSSYYERLAKRPPSPYKGAVGRSEKEEAIRSSSHNYYRAAFNMEMVEEFNERKTPDEGALSNPIEANFLTSFREAASCFYFAAKALERSALQKKPPMNLLIRILFKEEIDHTGVSLDNTAETFRQLGEYHEQKGFFQKAPWLLKQSEKASEIAPCIVTEMMDVHAGDRASRDKLSSIHALYQDAALGYQEAATVARGVQYRNASVKEADASIKRKEADDAYRAMKQKEDIASQKNSFLERDDTVSRLEEITHQHPSQDVSTKAEESVSLDPQKIPVGDQSNSDEVSEQIHRPASDIDSSFISEHSANQRQSYIPPILLHVTSVERLDNNVATASKSQEDSGDDLSWIHYFVALDDGCQKGVEQLSGGKESSVINEDNEAWLFGIAGL